MYINFHLDAFTTVVDVSDCINFHLDAFTTVVDVSDWKRHRKDDLFSRCLRTLEHSREYRLLKLDITQRMMQNV